MLNHLSLALIIRSLVHAETLPIFSLWRWYCIYCPCEAIVSVMEVTRIDVQVQHLCWIPISTFRILCWIATAAWCHISVVLPCPSSWVELEIMELGFLPGHLEFSYLWQRHKPCGQLFVRDETILPSSFGYHAQRACTTEIGAAHSTERFQPDLGEYSLNKFAFN